MSNIFNSYFFTRNPKLGYQFKVEFELEVPDDSGKIEVYGKTHEVSRRLSTCVKGVSIPSVKAKVNPYVTERMWNSYEYDFSDMVLKLTFEEDDNLLVNKFLMFASSISRPFIKDNNEQNTYNLIPNSYMRVYCQSNGTKGDKESGSNVYKLLDGITIKVHELNIDKNGSNNYESSLVHIFENCYLINQENAVFEYTESPKGVEMTIEFGFMRYYIQNPTLDGDNLSDETLVEKLNQEDNVLNEQLYKELYYGDLKKNGLFGYTTEAKKHLEEIKNKNPNFTTKSVEDFYKASVTTKDGKTETYSSKEVLAMLNKYNYLNDNVQLSMEMAANEFGGKGRISDDTITSILHNEFNLVVKGGDGKDVASGKMSIFKADKLANDNNGGIYVKVGDKEVEFNEYQKGIYEERKKDPESYNGKHDGAKYDIKPETNEHEYVLGKADDYTNALRKMQNTNSPYSKSGDEIYKKISEKINSGSDITEEEIKYLVNKHDEQIKYITDKSVRDNLVTIGAGYRLYDNDGISVDAEGKVTGKSNNGGMEVIVGRFGTNMTDQFSLGRWLDAGQNDIINYTFVDPKTSTTYKVTESRQRLGKDTKSTVIISTEKEEEEAKKGKRTVKEKREENKKASPKIPKKEIISK